MPAERTNRKARAGPSVPRPGPAGATEVHKPLALQHRTPDGIPGLSKLKASIRQTKRFLAKEGLEPGLKIQTQRRLESLEADLAKAERRGVEMKNGTKYHKVKFFERQKLLRIMKKQQRAVEKPETSSTKVQAAEQKLEHARVMLNYVLNFPNTEKYISLFPPASSSSSDAESEPTKARLPVYLDPSSPPPADSDKPGKRRLELLREMQRLMASGKLSQTPEVGLGTGEGKVRLDLEFGAGTVDVGGEGEAEGMEGGEVLEKEPEVKEGKKSKKEKKEKSKAEKEGKAGEKEVVEATAGDDFFED